MKSIKRLVLGTLLLATCATASAASSSVTELQCHKNLTMKFNLYRGQPVDVWTSAQFGLSGSTMRFTCRANDITIDPKDNNLAKSQIEPVLPTINISINEIPFILDQKDNYKACGKVWKFGQKLHFTAEWEQENMSATDDPVEPVITVTCSSLF